VPSRHPNRAPDPTTRARQASVDRRTLGRVICKHADATGAALVVMGRGAPHSALHGLLFGDAAAFVEKNCGRAAVRLVAEEELALGREGNA
jgi:hypothetical protein